MTDIEAPYPSENDFDRDALLSRLRLIDDQPLESRAVAFGQLYEELRATLESSDQGRSSRANG